MFPIMVTVSGLGVEGLGVEAYVEAARVLFGSLRGASQGLKNYNQAHYHMCSDLFILVVNLHTKSPDPNTKT